MAETQLARQILLQPNIASLGTISQEGPFVSLVLVAATEPTELVLLLSGLAKHTKNLAENPRCSALISATPEGAEPMASPRITVVGEVTKLPRDDDKEERATFLKGHPNAAMYADFGDFAFYRLTVAEAHLVAGFGRIETITAAQLRT